MFLEWSLFSYACFLNTIITLGTGVIFSRMRREASGLLKANPMAVRKHLLAEAL